MACTLPYIESKFRQSNPEVADKLNNQHIKIVQDAVDSNLFRFKDRKLLFSQEGTKKLDRQRDYVNNINQQYGVNVLKNVDGVLSVNVLGLAPSTDVPQVKEGVEFIFEQNPELASIGTQEQYSQYLDTILPDSKVEEIDNSLYISVLNQLEQENIIEKDCTGGGKLKAKDGISGKFTKGSQWEIYEIFEGKSHKQGGIEINIKNNQINFTNKNGSIKAKYGLVISKDS